MDCHVVTQSQTELKWGENSTQRVEFQIWKHDQAETKPRKPRAENQNVGGGEPTSPSWQSFCKRI